MPAGTPCKSQLFPSIVCVLWIKLRLSGAVVTPSPAQQSGFPATAVVFAAFAFILKSHESYFLFSSTSSFVCFLRQNLSMVLAVLVTM